MDREEEKRTTETDVENISLDLEPDPMMAADRQQWTALLTALCATWAPSGLCMCECIKLFVQITKFSQKCFK